MIIETAMLQADDVFFLSVACREAEQTMINRLLF